MSALVGTSREGRREKIVQCEEIGGWCKTGATRQVQGRGHVGSGGGASFDQSRPSSRRLRQSQAASPQQVVDVANPAFQ